MGQPRTTPLTIGAAIILMLTGAGPAAATHTNSAVISAVQARLRVRPTSSDRAPGTVNGGATTIGLLPEVHVGSLPQASAFDRATGTVYVANQNDNTVSVVDARMCSARDTSGCGQTPATVAVGAGPFSLAIDDRTHTVYVANQFGNTLSVINTAACNAQRTSGCATAPRTVAAGIRPFGIAIDRSSDTLYVADANYDFEINAPPKAGTLDVINGATCNATVTTGCSQQPRSVGVGNFPFYPFFDQETGTVDVPNANDNTISMIDARTCNAASEDGCGQVATVPTVPNPLAVVVDDRTGTLYAGSADSPVVAAVNAHTCNATRTSGCSVVGRLAIAGGADGMALDQATGTLLVANNFPGISSVGADSVSVIDASICSALDTTGCDQHAPTALTGANPTDLSIDPATGTAYVPTFDDTLSVVNVATCNGRVQTGCGQPALGALAGTDPIALAVNPVSSSVYIADAAGSEGFPSAISVLDDATCNTFVQSGCIASPSAFATPFLPIGVTFDAATGTLYTALLPGPPGPGNEVGVTNGATCTATDPSGCSVASSIATGNLPLSVAVDRATHTAYVANLGDGTVSLFDTSTCNATDTAGCTSLAATVTLGQNPNSVAVDQATNTIYTWNALGAGTVSVINGATCNVSDISGCSNTPSTISIGNDAPAFGFGGLNGIAINDATDTVYATNTADGTVSVIDGATCNGSVTSGCAQVPPTVPVGHQIVGGLAVDQTANRVYVANGLDDTVSVIDGATCNATTTSGCATSPPTVPGGPNPAAVGVNPVDGTAYVVGNGGGIVSFFRFVAPDPPTGVTATRSRAAIKLSWNPSYAGGLPIIYQVTPTPACPSCQGLSTPSTSGLPSTTVTGLHSGSNYTFTVRGVDAAGTGSPSSPSNPVTP